MSARTRSRHGMHVVKARVKVRSLAAIDKQTARRPRRFIAWHTELLSDLGGDENMTVQQTALVEMATRTKLYGDHLDAWLMGQESLVNRKRRRSCRW